MKNLCKRIIPTLLSVLCLATMLAFPASATLEDDLNEGRATITVTGAAPGDEFSVWQIVTIKHDMQSNALKYDFGTDAKPYFTAKGITIDNFMSAHDGMVDVVDGSGNVTGSVSMSDLFADLSVEISNNRQKWGTPNGGFITVGANGSGSTQQIPAGGYFLEPTKSTNIYQVMFTSIVPSVADGTYIFDNAVIPAKHTSVSLKKEVKSGTPENTASFGDAITASKDTLDPSSAYSTVTFRLVADIPKYVSGRVNTVILKDTLPTGLTLNQNTIKIYYTNSESDIDLTKNTALSQGVLESTSSGFTLDLTKDYDLFKGYQKIVVYYTASVNSQAPVKTDMTNTAQYTYSRYPYVDDSHINDTKEDNAKVNTYGLKVFKYTGNNTPLAGAKFTLYRTALSSETPDTNLTLNGASIPVMKITDNIQTGANGYAAVDGLSNAPQYYLVETAAPAGYKLDSTPLPVTLRATEADGYTTYNVENKQASLSLPTTGNTGMVIFTMIGLAGMTTAVLLLLSVSRKKKSTK